MRIATVWPALLGLLASLAQAAEPLPELPNFHLYSPHLASAGQPQRGQFAAIAAAGYQVVVNVAAPASNPDAVRDEKQLVEAAGMAYHHLPLSWDKPDTKQIVEVVQLLESLQGKAVLVHCYVNSRASLVAYLYRSMRAGAGDAEEQAVMVRLWQRNRGYEFENAPQWQFAVEDAKAVLARPR